MYTDVVDSSEKKKQYICIPVLMIKISYHNTWWNELGFLGHLSHSDDLLVWVGVRHASSVVCYQVKIEKKL